MSEINEKNLLEMGFHEVLKDNRFIAEVASYDNRKITPKGCFMKEVKYIFDYAQYCARLYVVFCDKKFFFACDSFDDKYIMGIKTLKPILNNELYKHDIELSNPKYNFDLVSVAYYFQNYSNKKISLKTAVKIMEPLSDDERFDLYEKVKSNGRWTQTNG